MPTTETRQTAAPPPATTSSFAMSPSRQAAERRLRIRESLIRLGLGLLGFAILLAVWMTISLTGWIAPGLIPTPLEVWNVMVAGFASGSLVTDSLVSIQRVLIGIAIGMIAAIPAGFVLGWFPRARQTFNPLVNFFRALPPIALVPLVIIYFGIGEIARESILVYAAFFATVIIVYEGVGSIEEKYVRAAKTLGASNGEVLLRVVLPLSLPHIFTAARVSLGVAWATLVAAELVAAQSGLGAAIQNASNFLNVPAMYAGIILIGLYALLMDVAIRAIGGRVLKWQERGNR